MTTDSDQIRFTFNVLICESVSHYLTATDWLHRACRMNINISFNSPTIRKTSFFGVQLKQNSNVATLAIKINKDSFKTVTVI